MFLESSGRTSCKDNHRYYSLTTGVELYLLLVETQSEVLHCLGIVLVLQADLAQGEEGLEEPLLYHRLVLLGQGLAGFSLQLVQQNHLGQFQHLPGQLEVGGIVLVLSLQGSCVLHLLLLTFNAVGLLLLLLGLSFGFGFYLRFVFTIFFLLLLLLFSLGLLSILVVLRFLL